MRELWLVRHGETEWSLSGAHTGRTDIPLTAAGREKAAAVGRYLAGCKFACVLVSPLQRARETCRLAGYENALIDPDLSEWDYGITKGAPHRRSRLNARDGRCGPTAYPTAKLPPKWPPAPTRDRRPRVRSSRGTSHSSPTATSCACWPRAGSDCRPKAAVFSPSAPPQFPLSATNARRA